jgi:hypothetical protein
VGDHRFDGLAQAGDAGFDPFGRGVRKVQPQLIGASILQMKGLARNKGHLACQCLLEQIRRLPAEPN